MLRVQEILDQFDPPDRIRDDTLFRVEFAWEASVKIMGFAPLGPAFTNMVLMVFLVTAQDHEDGLVGII